MAQLEILRPIPLLDDMGKPDNFGWARQPHFVYNSEMVYAQRHRLTASDRYIVHSPTHLVVFEIKDDGWVGHMAVSILSIRDKKRSTQVFETLLPIGSSNMPDNSQTGSARWRRKKTHLDFINMGNGFRIIKADISKFGHNRSMRCAVVLKEPEDVQSIVTNQPWRDNKFSFRYTRCSPCLIAEGVIQLGSSEIVFSKGHAWGIFDWYRSARPKADIRYWAAACGITDGKLLGFCVGYSWADFSLGTENGFFVDGILHKLDQVTFHIPLSNWLSPWRFTSNDNRLEMTFYPHQERIDRRRFFFYSSARRQVFGIFSGKVHLDDGSIVEFQNLTGFAERCKMLF